MKSVIHFRTAIPSIVVTLALACFWLLPRAQAVVPAPDGGYPSGNTAEGQNALLSLTSGGYNAAVGWSSLKKITTGSFNTAVGAGTLALNTADENTATGTAALLFNITGSQNTASGAFALFSNNTGNGNTATGFDALFSNTTGGFNTADGGFALHLNTTGTSNTAAGAGALQVNTIGNYNTATGSQALLSNTIGDFNTATGSSSLYGNTTGTYNTAIGESALVNNTIGSFNIALGYSAGSNVTGGANIDIGNDGLAGESNTIRIGTLQATAFIAGIRGVMTGNADAIPVMIDSAGQLGTASSARRFKNKIKPMGEASEALLALKPVTFQYTKDNTSTPQFGLIAEEVAEINPDLVVRDKDGEIYTVRYDAVNAMLLNEFLKEHRAFVEEQRKLEDQQKEIDSLKAELKEQKSLIQKVSDKIEVRQATTRVAGREP